jgi:hypothetical protein
MIVLIVTSPSSGLPTRCNLQHSRLSLYVSSSLFLPADYIRRAQMASSLFALFFPHETGRDCYEGFSRRAF